MQSILVYKYWCQDRQTVLYCTIADVVHHPGFPFLYCILALARSDLSNTIICGCLEFHLTTL